MEYLKMKRGLSGRTKEEKIQKSGGETFRTHVLRYGTILTDDSHENENGSFREMNIHINDMIASVEMKNGHVTSWGLSSYDYFKTENINDEMSRKGKQIRLILK